MQRDKSRDPFYLYLIAIIVCASMASCTKPSNEVALDQAHVCYNHKTWEVLNVNFEVYGVSSISSDSCKVAYFDSVTTDMSHFTASYGYSTDGPAQKTELYHKVLQKMSIATNDSIIVRGQIWVNTQDQADKMARVVGIYPITPDDHNYKKIG